MSESPSTVRTGENPLPGLIRALQDLDTDLDDAARIDAIRQLEELRSAVAAAQARMTAAFTASQRSQPRAPGVSRRQVERSIVHQVGLTRRVSPFQARRYVGWAGILTTELPETFAVLAAGRTTEWRAMIVARETAWLSREHRTVVDRELAPRLERLGDKKTEAEAKTIAYRLDPHGYVARLGSTESERRVTLRPAPDVMTRLSALLPMAQGIAAHTALAKAADTLVVAGDERTRSQIMADLLVTRLTGQETATAVPVEVQVVLDAGTLLGGGTEPARVAGYGPVPAPWARNLILDSAAARWIRRLYAAPHSSQLIAMESRRRCFTPAQRRFVLARDHVCRTPWCEAPVRQVDHVTPAEHGGPTTIDNAAGLCVACNLAKQSPGWQSRPSSDGSIITRTSTGHTYHSRPPDLVPKRRSPTDTDRAGRLGGAA